MEGLNEKLSVADLRVDLRCGAFVPHTDKELEKIPQCYQCINRHCTIGLNNFFMFKDDLLEDKR